MKPVDSQTVLSGNLRRLRDLTGVTQVELASRARQLGFDWVPDTVVAVETGRRRLTGGEQLVIPQLLEATLLDLAATTAELVDVDGALMKVAEWHTLIAGGRLKTLNKRWFESGAGLLRQGLIARNRAVAAEASNEAEKKAARRLGMPGPELVELAHERWGRGLTAERDRRVRSDSGDRELSRAARQALRGHVTRALLAELREVIALKEQKARDALPAFMELMRHGATPPKTPKRSRK